MERSDVVVGARRRRVFVAVGGTIARTGESASALFARADLALYWAKTGGRARVEIDA